MFKVKRVLLEAFFLAKNKDVPAAIKFILNKCYSSKWEIIFEKILGETHFNLPEFLQIVKIDPQKHAEYEEELVEAGLGSDLHYFDDGATCYIAYLDGRLVGMQWRFKRSRMLRALNYPSNTVYLGGAFVKESARGKGIYPFLNRYVSNEMPGLAAVAETAHNNYASHRALEKAGYKRRGRLHVIIILGVIVYCKLVEN